MEISAAARSTPGARPADDSVQLLTIGAVALVIGYFAAGLGYVLTLRPAGIVFLWPPSGLVLGALMLMPRRQWPAVLAGAFVGNVLADTAHGATLILALAGGVANSFEEFAAAWVVTTFSSPNPRFASVRDTGVFLLGAVIGTNSLTSLIGSVVMMGYRPSSFWAGWLHWWAGDGMGMLIVAPAVVTGFHSLRTRGRLSLRRLAIDASFVASVGVAAALLLGVPASGQAVIETYALLAYPFLIVAGIRLGPWGAATASLVLTGVAAWFAIDGRLRIGIANEADQQILEVYSYLALAAISALIPAAVLAEREETAMELRASERRFREIAENIEEAFFVVDLPDWRPVYVSPSWSTIWGRPMSHGYDSRLWLEAVHPDDRDKMRAAQAADVAGKPSVTEFRIIRPDGSVRSLRGRAFPIRDAAGLVSRVVGIAEDVTLLRDTEKRFSQAQKLEAVGRLAGGVAHDFNNLLTVIFAESDFLSEAPLAPRDRESVSEIRRAAESASALTRQLLAFSRRQIIAPSEFDLNDVVKDVSRMVGRLIGEDITLVVHADDEALGVLADRGQVEQLITNLAVNARDAMPRGGALSIETRAVTDPAPTDIEAHAPTTAADGEPPLGWVALSVHDSGTGIPPDVLAHVFEPFFTTKELGRGTGLGLATCHGIVAQSGGRIGINSMAGVGTTVRILLPRVAITGASGTAVPAPVAGGRERVLLVEDETGVRKATARLLRARGYDVIEARDGDDALRLLGDAQRQIDLLLTDVVLPHMSGRELAERVHNVRPAVKTLFASGYTDDVVLRDQMLSRDAAFVAKPFTADTLARRVREVLDAEPDEPEAGE